MNCRAQCTHVYGTFMHDVHFKGVFHVYFRARFVHSLFQETQRFIILFHRNMKINLINAILAYLNSAFKKIL